MYPYAPSARSKTSINCLRIDPVPQDPAADTAQPPDTLQPDDMPSLNHSEGETPELPTHPDLDPDVDHFTFVDATAELSPETAQINDGRSDPPAPQPADPPDISDADPDPAPAPIDPPAPDPAAPTQTGRGDDATPGTPTVTPLSPPPPDVTTSAGRDPDAVPDTVIVTEYTSGGDSSAYNVTIEFVGTWTADLQASFIAAADYLSTIILADLPDVMVDGLLVDDLRITATLEGIDGVGGILGSAGPRALRNDGTFLPATGEMTFDSADADNQLAIGNWDTIVLHEMMHTMGFGTLWGLLNLTTGTVADGDIRFAGSNANSVYATEFPDVFNTDPDSATGIPVEADGGPGTAGGHWDELLFNEEIMTGFVDPDGFVSTMTIASLEDLGYDTVFDDPDDPSDLTAPTPADPLADMVMELLA